MLCQNCNKNVATFFYTETINGKTHSIALCDECKAKHDHAKHYNEGFGNFFQEMMFPSSLFLSNAGPSFTSTVRRCPVCSASAAEIKSGKVELCRECYNFFKEDISSVLKAIHGSAKHVGRTPSYIKTEESPAKGNDRPEKEISEVKSEENEYEKLKKELGIAISEERYEDAAILRDKLKELEKEDNYEN